MGRNSFKRKVSRYGAETNRTSTGMLGPSRKTNKGRIRSQPCLAVTNYTLKQDQFQNTQRFLEIEQKPLLPGSLFNCRIGEFLSPTRNFLRLLKKDLFRAIVSVGDHWAETLSRCDK